MTDTFTTATDIAAAEYGANCAAEAAGRLATAWRVLWKSKPNSRKVMMGIVFGTSADNVRALPTFPRHGAVLIDVLPDYDVLRDGMMQKSCIW